jgi:hypothetical protein
MKAVTSLGDVLPFNEKFRTPPPIVMLRLARHA